MKNGSFFWIEPLQKGHFGIHRSLPRAMLKLEVHVDSVVLQQPGTVLPSLAWFTIESHTDVLSLDLLPEATLMLPLGSCWCDQWALLPPRSMSAFMVLLHPSWGLCQCWWPMLPPRVLSFYFCYSLIVLYMYIIWISTSSCCSLSCLPHPYSISISSSQVPPPILISLWFFCFPFHCATFFLFCWVWLALLRWTWTGDYLLQHKIYIYLLLATINCI